MAYKCMFKPNEELSEIATKLWELDENRCEPGVDFELDLQGYVTDARRVRRDYADYPFFCWVDEERVFERPTYKAFRNLLDNYESETGRPEVVTAEEEAENRLFIDVIMETAVMQELHQYLVSKGKAPEGVGDFKWKLYKLWFKLYRRLRGDRHLDSSGFEHVFVGETRGQEVIGFHNWIQLYLQEKRGNIDYRGYFRRGTTTDVDEDFDDDYEDDPGAREDNPRLVTIQFVWKRGQAKPIGSSFIGTSPEFEIALYTLIHMLNDEDKIPMRLAHYDVEICCYGHGKGIGTAYPNAK